MKCLLWRQHRDQLLWTAVGARDHRRSDGGSRGTALTGG